MPRLRGALKNRFSVSVLLGPRPVDQLTEDDKEVRSEEDV